MRKSKKRYFYHIFVFPGDVPEGITLNFVWMEREFDAYKLFRCMCPSNYNCFWDRARYLWKSPFYHTPCIRRPVRGVPSKYRHPFGMGKLEWCRYPTVKQFRRYVYSFWRDPRTWRTDGRTNHGQTLRASKDRADASHRAVKRLAQFELKILVLVLSCFQFVWLFITMITTRTRHT